MQRLFSKLVPLNALILGIAGLSALLATQQREAGEWSTHTLVVIYKDSDLLSAYQDMNLSSRGYALQKDSKFQQIFSRSQVQSVDLLNELRQLTKDNPSQQKRLNDLLPVAENFRTLCQQVLNGQFQLVDEQREAMMSIRQILSSVRAEETRLLSQRQQRSQDFYIAEWVALAVLILATLILLGLTRRSISAYAQENSRRIAQLETARSQAEAARQVAETALQSKSRFLSMITHEIRTPMAAIIGLTELLTKDDLGNEKNQMIASIFDSSTRLLRLLNNVLEAATLESGNIAIENRSFPLRALLGEVRQLIMPEASKKSLSVTGHCDDEIPETVVGDELRLRQILVHLLSNAVLYSKEGQVDLSARVKERGPDHLRVEFQVKDSGPGISAELQKRLFMPFERAADSHTRQEGGSGLGLSITKELVALMQGSISVTSQEGVGSCFSVEIPFQLAESQA